MSLFDNTVALQQILDTVNSLPDGDDEINLQNKTVSPTTERQIITADSGYDGLDTVTVNAMTTATQATPTISVNTSGLITTSSMQTAGYVSAGAKSATKQLTVQAAKTVTPSTSNQTAVASGVYTTGAVTVKGDSNLVADNIKSGVSIFGVSGSYEGSGGGASVEACAVNIVLPLYTNLIGTVLIDGEAQMLTMYMPFSVNLSGLYQFVIGSFICIGTSTNVDKTGAISVTGGIELVSGNTKNTCGAVLKVNGAGTITFHS